MKIEVTSRGGESPVVGKYAAQRIRSAIESAGSYGTEYVPAEIVDCTNSLRAVTTDYAVVAEDDGTVLWSGWLDGRDEPAPLDPVVAAIEIGRRIGLVAPEVSAIPETGGQWLSISFMGHLEYTGYVTEITKHGQPAYRIDLPEKIWGGNPLAFVTHAASSWFSDRPVTEESVRKAWEAQRERAARRAREEAEWQERRALEAADGNDDGPAF